MAKQSSQPINWTTIAIVLIVVVSFLFAIMYLFPSSSSERTVSTTGNARLSVAPDKVVVYAQVLTRSKTSADEAKDLNAEISNAVLAALAKAGVSSNDIETSGFSVSPEYDWIQNEGQVLKGYMATNSIKITFYDFKNAGKIVDAVVDSGGLINYINYELTITKMNEYKAQALAEASADARAKATAIVSGLGKKLGELVSVSSSDYNYYPYPIYRMESESDVKQIATNLPSANVEITATVHTVYKVV